MLRLGGEVDEERPLVATVPGVRAVLQVARSGQVDQQKSSKTRRYVGQALQHTARQHQLYSVLF